MITHGEQLTFDFRNYPEDSLVRLFDCTRVEVIGIEGRDLVLQNISDVSISMQDGNRTLKVFYENGSQERYSAFISRKMKEDKNEF